MHLQATLDARALKPFTRALTCISKYGDEMIMHVNKDTLVLTSINQAKSAFCSFSYRRGFFQKYVVSQGGDMSGRQQSRVVSQNETTIKCQLQTKSLLAVLKHRNNEKGLQRCDLTIIDGQETPEEEIRVNEDSLESRLIVRLHFRLGVVKTHRLLLNSPMNDDAPVVFNELYESRILVQAHIVKEMIEHFPNTRGSKNDPELVWTFTDEDVRISNVDKGDKGRSQIVSELTLGGNEFDRYEISLSPVTIAFFLREFYATVLLADALSTTLEIRFTENEKPVYINTDTDDCTMLFVIATNHIRELADLPRPQQVRRTQPQPQHTSTARAASGVANAEKRSIDNGESSSRALRPRLETASSPSNGVQSISQSVQAESQSRTPFSPMMDQTGDSGLVGGADMDYNHPDPGLSQNPPGTQPLFLASQLTAAEKATMEEAGFGVDDMNADELAQMLGGEDIEEKLRGQDLGEHGLLASALRSRSPDDGDGDGSDELDADSLGPTQVEHGLSEKSFKPLFDD